MQLLSKVAAFSGVGLICTLVSLLLIFVLNTYTDLNVLYSYIVAYGLSILLSYILNTRLVFTSHYSLVTLIGYLFIYLSSMGLGAGLILGLKYFLPWSDWFISYTTIPFTMAWNFLFSKKLFKN